MKKKIRIIIIVFIVLVVLYGLFSVLFNNYLENEIRKQNERIRNQNLENKTENFIDNSNKIQIKYNVVFEKTFYNVDFENHNIEIIKRTDDIYLFVGYRLNIFFIWRENKNKLENLKQFYILDIMKLSSDQETSLKQIIDSTIEDYNNQNNDDNNKTTTESIAKQANEMLKRGQQCLTISTIDEKDILVEDDRELMLFLERFNIINK